MGWLILTQLSVCISIISEESWRLLDIWIPGWRNDTTKSSCSNFSILTSGDACVFFFFLSFFFSSVQLSLSWIDVCFLGFILNHKDWEKTDSLQKVMDLKEGWTACCRTGWFRCAVVSRVLFGLVTFAPREWTSRWCFVYKHRGQRRFFLLTAARMAWFRRYNPLFRKGSSSETLKFRCGESSNVESHESVSFLFSLNQNHQVFGEAGRKVI